MRTLQRLAAAFRLGLSRLHDDQYGADKVPDVIKNGWEDLLCKVHMLIRPETTNQWVREGVLKFSNGTDCGPMLDFMIPENLHFLEDLLDCDGPGICRASPSFCAWLRDIVDPIGQSDAAPGAD